MLGHGLVHTAFSGAAGSLAVFCALLIFSGFLAPFEPKSRALRERRRAGRSGHEPSPTTRRDRAEASAISLNAIELSLLAELNIERACDHDAMASDAARRPEVRRAEAAAATAWRERARLFQLEAVRRSAHPMVPGEAAPVMDFVCTGPERRREMRRQESRRGGEAASERRDLGDRRTPRERRRGDRRDPGLAVR
jgi:hypothetical protein